MNSGQTVNEVTTQSGGGVLQGSLAVEQGGRWGTSSQALWGAEQPCLTLQEGARLLVKCRYQRKQILDTAEKVGFYHLRPSQEDIKRHENAHRKEM